MCSSASSNTVVISVPGTAAVRLPSAARRKRGRPSTSLWSQSATAVRPRASAAETISSGVQVPSEKVECVCRSQLMGSPLFPVYAQAHTQPALARLAQRALEAEAPHAAHGDHVALLGPR